MPKKKKKEIVATYDSSTGEFGKVSSPKKQTSNIVATYDSSTGEFSTPSNVKDVRTVKTSEEDEANKKLLNTLKTNSDKAEKEYDDANYKYLKKTKKLKDENINPDNLLKNNKEAIKKLQDPTRLQKDAEKVFKKTKKEYKDMEEKRNKFALENYKYNVTRYNEKNYKPGVVEDVYNKTLGGMLRPATEMIGNLIGRPNEKYVDENGKVTYLPSELSIKNQRVADTFGNDLLGKTGKFFYNLEGEGAKIAAAMGLDAITFGTLGTVAYNNDLAHNAYTQAVNEGASDKNALLNAAGKTATNFVGGKLIGSATKGLTKIGGNTLAETEAGTAFSNFLEKQIGKKVTNKAASKILSSAASEGVEEGLQEYLDAGVDTLTLGKKYDVGKTTKNALKSAVAGGVLGGVINTPGALLNNSSNIDIESKKTNVKKGSSWLSKEQELTTKEQTINQIKQQVESKQITPEQGQIQIEQVQDGSYYKKRNLATIANQQVQDVIQAKNQGLINPLEAQNQMNSILQTMDNQRLQINEQAKTNKIKNAVNNYIENNKVDFSNKPKISTENIQKNNIDYSKAKQTVIFKKIRDNMAKFKTNIFKNNQTNKDIFVSSQDINKDINSTLKNPEQKNFINEHIAVYNNIDEVINNAELITSSSDYKNRSEYDNWNYFVSPVNIDGKNFIVEFDTVKNHNTGDEHFRLKRLYEFSNNKKRTGSGGGYPLGTTSSSELNIPQTNQNVNDISTINNMQNNENNTLNQPQILDKIPKQDKGIKNTIEELKDAKNVLRQKFTDHGQAIYDLSRKINNPTLYHKYDSIASASQIAQDHLGKKQTNLQGKPYKNFVDENGNKTTMGFEKAYDMYKDISVKDKNTYLVHQLNLDRLSKGVEQFNFTEEQSNKIIKELENKHPDIKKWAENIWTYNKNQLQNMVDGGLITKQQADTFLNDTPHYVRIQRDVNGAKQGTLNIRNGKIEINNPIQKIKGSELDTLPIKETTAEYTDQVLRAIKTNQFGQELSKSMSVGSQDNSISAVDESFGINPDLIGQDENGNYTFTIFNNGTATVIPINKEIANALQPRDIRTSKLNPAMHVSNIQRTLLTDKNPYFMIRNGIKDAADMFLYSKHSMRKSLTTYAELFGGRTVGRLYNKATNNQNAGTATQWLDLYESLGGNSSSIFNQGEFTSKKNKVSKVIDKALSPIEKGNQFIESMPRLTEFVNTIRENGYTLDTNRDIVPQKGKNPTKSVDEVLNEAMYNAADITVNFKRGGTWAKNIDKNGATFFNASVQGASKLGRTFTEAFGDAKNGDYKAAKRLVGRVLALGVAPAIINNMMHGDDDEYKNLPDYIKDQYYLIKGKNGKWIRIPKGRATSLLESAARRTIDKSKGGKFGVADYANLITNQIAPNNPLENNSLSPLISAATNKSWNGSDIVSSYLENKTNPQEEYDAKTSEISKWIGKQLGISPKKLDYVIDQYSGVLGDIALPSTTNYAESKDSSGFNALTNPLKSQFTVDSVLTNKSTQRYYDELQKAEDNKKLRTATDKDKLKYKALSSVSKEITDLRNTQKEIQNDKSLSDSEKYSQSKKLQKQINNKQNDAIKNSDKVKIYEDYAKVGKDIYYKNSKGEWQKESEKEKNRREWTTYSIADYYAMKKEKAAENKLKKAEKASQDSNFASSIGISDYNFEKYKYQANKVEGVKGSNGRTIRGSVKAARQRYINTLPLSAQQKQELYNYLFKRRYY